MDRAIDLCQRLSTFTLHMSAVIKPVWCLADWLFGTSPASTSRTHRRWVMPHVSILNRRREKWLKAIEQRSKRKHFHCSARVDIVMSSGLHSSSSSSSSICLNCLHTLSTSHRLVQFFFLFRPRPLKRPVKQLELCHDIEKEKKKREMDLLEHTIKCQQLHHCNDSISSPVCRLSGDSIAAPPRQYLDHYQPTNRCRNT